MWVYQIYYMAEPVKYITLVTEMMMIYQKELVRLYKKCTSPLVQTTTK